MELIISYEQIVGVLYQLSENQLISLRHEIDRLREEPKKILDREAFQHFLLSAPTMSADQYKTFKRNRKHFNQWRRKKKSV